MARAEKEYVRLPGRGYRRLGRFVAYIRAQLWLGKDHLLSVDQNYFTEEYKRFYFQDIQALIVRKTRWGAIANGILGVIVLLLALACLPDPHNVVVLIALALFVLLLAINILRGPTCSCHIQTAVQTDHLPTLNRVRVARRVFERIVPEILRAQGVDPQAGFTPPAAASVAAEPGRLAEGEPSMESSPETTPGASE